MSIVEHPTEPVEDDPLDLDPDHDPWQAIGRLVLVVGAIVAILMAWKYWK